MVYRRRAHRQRDAYGEPAQYIGAARRVGLRVYCKPGTTLPRPLVVFSQYFYRLRKASIRVPFRSLDMPSVFWSVPALVDISAGMPTP